jgi:hypothetical protein
VQIPLSLDIRCLLKIRSSKEYDLNSFSTSSYKPYNCFSWLLLCPVSRVELKVPAKKPANTPSKPISPVVIFSGILFLVQIIVISPIKVMTNNTATIIVLVCLPENASTLLWGSLLSINEGLIKSPMISAYQFIPD